MGSGLGLGLGLGLANLVGRDARSVAGADEAEARAHAHRRGRLRRVLAASTQPQRRVGVGALGEERPLPPLVLHLELPLDAGRQADRRDEQAVVRLDRTLPARSRARHRLPAHWLAPGGPRLRPQDLRRSAAQLNPARWAGLLRQCRIGEEARHRARDAAAGASSLSVQGPPPTGVLGVGNQGTRLTITA